MYRLAFASCVLSIATAAGCGGSADDSSSELDGAIAPDGGGDGVPVDCVPERNDDRNDDTAEQTGLTYAGSRVALCGTIEVNHPSGDLIDLDRYQITVAPLAPVVVRLTAPLGGEVDRIEMVVRDAAGPRALARLRAGNAVTALLLPQGEYTISVEARSAAAEVPIPYRIEVHADDPALRCPPMPGGTIHLEADESTMGHRANDVIEAFDQPPILATQATQVSFDAPDATGQAVTAGDRFTIEGFSADVASGGDAYQDRDAFSLYTGATTNQLDIRATWTDGIADLDVLVFEAGSDGEPMGTPTAAVLGEEIVITAVEPSTAYWLWIGGSTRSAQLPVTYAVHVCGREIAAAPAD
jgi:hypothetical protein